VTEEPRPLGSSNAALSTHSSGSQAAASSSLRRSRTFPRQRRLDTEEGGRGAGRGDPAVTNPAHRRTSSTSRSDDYYYWGYGVQDEEGKEKWEDKIYRLWVFKGLLFALLLGWMALWTWMAVGWLGSI
jgi:hypothetical protein